MTLTFDNGQVAAYLGGGLLAVLTLVKGVSTVIRSWTGDRTGDAADKSATNQIEVLQKENHILREENTKLREDWQAMVKVEAELSAGLESLKERIIEQNIKISNMSRLIVHLIQTNNGASSIPPDLLASLMGLERGFTRITDKLNIEEHNGIISQI